jgi:hypothetical protein
MEVPDITGPCGRSSATRTIYGTRRRFMGHSAFSWTAWHFHGPRGPFMDARAVMGFGGVVGSPGRFMSQRPLYGSTCRFMELPGIVWTSVPVHGPSGQLMSLSPVL